MLIVWALRDELLHGLWAVLWCSPFLLVLLLILTTRLRCFWESMMQDSLCRILILPAIGLLVVGLSWQSHVFADVHMLGF
jgi:hypothetical protein